MISKNSFLILLVVFPLLLTASVGCDLNDPDKDVKRLFPSSTGYKTVYMSIMSNGGIKLLESVESELGDKFKGLYETIDVPYTIYEIYQGEKKTGYIHGVNQKGKYGGIQLFLALDANHRIISVYFQKMSAKKADKFKEEAFAGKFQGLTLTDFRQYNVVTGESQGKTSQIKAPVPELEHDFRAIMRAIKKNLILMDEFFKK